MSLNTTTSIKEKYGSLILLLIIPLVLVFVGSTLENYFGNVSSSFDDIQAWVTTIIICVVMYSLGGSLLYSAIEHRENILLLGVLMVMGLCVVALAVTTDSVKSLPFYEECKKLADVSDISMSECMNVIDVNASHTGQEIVDVVKAHKIVETTTELEILNRLLKP